IAFMAGAMPRLLAFVGWGNAPASGPAHPASLGRCPSLRTANSTHDAGSRAYHGISSVRKGSPMHFVRTTAFAACLLAVAPAFAQHHGHGGHQRSPYASETGRQIKALSADEQRAWLEGQGQGLARAAELNG